MKDSNHKPFVNLDSLVGKLSGNYRQILKCLDIFKRDAPALVDSLREALRNDEGKKAKDSCHGLRGLLIILEMHRPASTAAALETMIIEKKFDTCREMLPLLEDEIKTAVGIIETSIAVTE